MRRGRGGDRHRLDVRVAEERFGIGEGAGRGVEGVKRGQGLRPLIADGAQLTDPRQIAEQVPPPVSGADEGQWDRTAAGRAPVRWRGPRWIVGHEMAPEIERSGTGTLAPGIVAHQSLRVNRRSGT